MRLRITFEFQVLRGLCFALGNGVVSVGTAQAALKQATLNAILHDDDSKIIRSIQRGFTKASTVMGGSTHSVLINVSDNLIAVCNQTQDSFPEWFRAILLAEAKKIKSAKPEREEPTIIVSPARSFI
jgi:hypothetical protein